jgi:hypothetical protein
MLKAILLLGSYAIAVPWLLVHVGSIASIGETLTAIDPRLTATGSVGGN